MENDLPNLKYDHVFAVIRIDESAIPGIRCSRDNVTVTKVLLSKEHADEEVARLTALNAATGCEYFCQITRIERSEN